MANAEHLALLQQGAAIWNDWRIRNPGSLPDLSAADLSEALLNEANLRKANLRKADLSEELPHPQSSARNAIVSIKLSSEANSENAFRL